MPQSRATPVMVSRKEVSGEKGGMEWERRWRGMRENSRKRRGERLVRGDGEK